MKTYLTKTKHNTYKYIRRVPQELLEYTPSNRFRVSLGSNELEAIQMAVEFNSAIENALQLFQLHLPSSTIIEKLEHLLPKEPQEEKQQASLPQGTLKELSREYLASKQQNISKDETRDKKYFYEEVAPAIFFEIGLTNNPKLAKITYSHLLDCKNIFTSLPKRNIQKYRTMELSKILNGLAEVQENERISARTINKYIKWLRALFNFAVVTNHLQVNLANSLPLQKTVDDKLQRLPLSDEELKLLLDNLPQKMKYLVQVLALTGMRLSELYKCKVVEVEGIKSFSLLDRELKLKTKSSYRIIPIHSSLLTQIDSFESHRNTVTSNNLARVTSNTIKALKFLDSAKKSLYSLRHSFATSLVQKGADTVIVSELLGHSHSTMTLSRYATGFSAKQLVEVVELL